MNKWIRIEGYKLKFKCPYCGYIGNSLTGIMKNCPMCDSKVIERDNETAE